MESEGDDSAWKMSLNRHMALKASAAVQLGAWQDTGMKRYFVVL